MRIIDKEKLEANIKKVAMQDIDGNDAFGLAYLVTQNGEKVYEGFFGSMGPDRQQELNGKTMFRIASMTKPITAVAALILIERGLLSLDTPVKNYYPEFENLHIYEDGVDKGVVKTEIKLVHLLSHTSGFGVDGAGKPAPFTAADKVDIESTISYFVKRGLAFEPMKKGTYSSFGSFDVITGIIEKVTGEDYGEFLKREIFDKCGMVDTTFSPNDEQWSRMISMHTKVAGKNAVGVTWDGCVMGDFPSSHKLGGAGLASTLDDYAKFAKMLLNNGMGENGRVMLPETCAEMYKTYVSENSANKVRNTDWGLAVRVITDDSYGNLPAGCYGWSGAFGCHYWVDPANKITAVFMKNTKAAGDRYASGYRFEKAVTDSLL